MPCKHDERPFITKSSRSEKTMQSVVKLFVQMSTPNYCMPWQMKRQQQASGSGFVIAGQRILTNAHVVAYHKSIRVKKHGDAKKYNAHIIHMAHECDIAMVGVSDEAFWEGLEALDFGDIPQLEEDIVVVGFPTGGDNISVTRGVVSRVDIQRYSHSGAHLLAIQIDAAINSGNSGGPALKEGKVVGIAFETLSDAENIGYIIPTPVIHHFLEDVGRNNQFSGFCNLGIRWQPIESDHMRKYFQLAPKQTGVLISRILKLSCSFGLLQRGDVLMALDGTNVADDGTVPFRGSERILWNYLTHFKYPNDVLTVSVLRAGKVIDVQVVVGLISFLVPAHLYDKRPSYVVYSGLVFVSLSQPYMLHQYGKDWGRKAPIRLCDRILYGVQEKPEQEVVILSQVLASELTAGYDSFANLQLYRVNGVPVLNLKHLCHILDKLTVPCMSSSDSGESSSLDSETRKLANKTANLPVAEPQEVPEPISAERKGSDVTVSDRELESYVSFDVLGEAGDENERAVEVGDVLQEHSNPRRELRALKAKQEYVSDENLAYSEFTTATENFYYGAGDDPLLLDCTNYVHFELDKDKVVVFNIASAYKKNVEILAQYAISSPRSDDLPVLPY